MKPKRKLQLLAAGAVLAALGAGGFLVAASGIIPIKASSGHWPITEWFLHFSMRRSITTHSFMIEVPPLEDRSLLLRGAGHYETACRPCHGSPGSYLSPVFQAMTPPPPYLPPRLPHWHSEDLFYIVKHGVKFAGMPAWPTQKRDDEVWAMVAFLRRFPALDASEYRDLVHGKAEQPSQAVPMPAPQTADPAARVAMESCARCHGVEGLGRGTGAFPRLAGQKPEYMLNALKAYAKGKRYSGVMQTVAAQLKPETMQELSVWYANLRSEKSAVADDATAAAIERGRAIAENGIPEKRVASCVDCHGPGAKHGKPAYPRLSGQYPDYLYLQLQLFKKKHRGGSQYAHLMWPIASKLSDDQMRDVALYYGSLAWPAGGR